MSDPVQPQSTRPPTEPAAAGLIPAPPLPSVRTGLAEVDAVLASVEAIDAGDPASHVAVYEDAHDRLRRALDASPPTPDR